jgi:chromosome segregation ATPase
MHINNENEPFSDVKADNNPLSVRIDAQFKEMFNNLIKEKDISKKQLLECMIENYIINSSDKEREEHISFSNEINLISTGLDEILKIFKIIAAKSQDTLGSVKNLNEQKLEDLNKQLEASKLNLSEIAEKNKLLEISNNALGLEKEKADGIAEELKQKLASYETEIGMLNRKNQELLEQLNELRVIENNNHQLTNENEKLSVKITELTHLLRDKNFENELLNSRIKYLEEAIEESKDKRTQEIKELELKIKQQADIDKKMELLQMQSKYNDLQAENMRNLCEINQKSEEIMLLKSKSIGT